MCVVYGEGRKLPTGSPPASQTLQHSQVFCSSVLWKWKIMLHISNLDVGSRWEVVKTVSFHSCRTEGCVPSFLVSCGWLGLWQQRLKGDLSQGLVRGTPNGMRKNFPSTFHLLLLHVEFRRAFQKRWWSYSIVTPFIIYYCLQLNIQTCF